jgi:predicted metalloprotease with PDZ domain
MIRKLKSQKLVGPIVLFVLLTFAAHDTLAENAVQTLPQQAAVSSIEYTVSMPRPWTHLLEVEMRVRWPRSPGATQLKMAVWTPGSYLIREYARHVQSFTVTDAAGRELGWEKINKNTWQVNAAGTSEIVARYKVYSNELTVRTNELNDEHAFWNNGALLMYPAGELGAPSTITVRPYGDWKIATGLRPVAGRPNTFTAPNFDILFDSPFEVSNFREHTFMAAGAPHRLVITGDGNYDMEQIGVDTDKIADEAVKIFGDLPVEDYLIILNLRGGGGLEHLNSTALQWNRWGFKPRSRYIAFLNLVAHEYFHLWNVKRIRPYPLGPFDYENENYTKLLWVAEGTTSYYEGILLMRAGLISQQEFLASKAGVINALQNRPGRFETSLEEASFDAWIKYYRQDENAINNQISYYDKGDIVSMMLDVVIRTSSNGERSLDNVLRYLNDEFAKKDRAFTSADFQKASEMMAGRSLEDFFARYVRGREEIDYNAILNPIGLQLVGTGPADGTAFLGATLGDVNGQLTVRNVPAGTPAHDQGLNFNDQILAVDGYRASQAFLNSYIGEKRPGDEIRLTVFRFDQLRDITIKLGADTRQQYTLRADPNASETAARLRAQYLGN